MEEEDNGALSSFMKQQVSKTNQQKDSAESNSFGIFSKKNNKNKKSDDLNEKEKTKEEKELEEAKKESKALAARMASIEPELVAIRFKRMLVFYSIGAIIILIFVYAHMRNPMWFSNLLNKGWNSIFFR